MEEYSRGILILHILDRAPTLDAPYSESVRVGKAADDPCLPLERALERLVELGRVFQVDDVDIAVGRAHHQQVVSHVHGVNSFLALHRRRRLALPQIPVFDGLIPRSCDHHRGAAVLEEPDGPHRQVVLRNLHGLEGREVADLGLLVGTGGDHFLPILGRTTC